jgi:hypothetical protein
VPQFSDRARRTRRQLLVSLSVALVLLTLPALAGATDVSFDDLSPGTAVNQYPAVNPAVSFVYPTNVGFSIGSPGDGVASQHACGTPFVTPFTPTSSEPNMGSFSCGGSEFPAHGTFAVLTDFANSVSAFVGDPVGTGYNFELDAYDINRHLLGSDPISTSQLGPRNLVSYSVPGGAYTIAYVAIYALGNSDHSPTGMDDLSFNACTPGVTCNPEISLSSSAGGGISQGGHVQYHVSLFRHNGSNGNVALSTSGLAGGIHTSFTPSVIPGTGTTSALDVTVDDNAATGGSTGTITAVPSAGAGSATQTDPITVQVEAPFGTYVGQSSSQPSQPSISLPPCSAARETVRTLLGPAFNGSPVDLAISSNGDTSDISSIALDKPRSRIRVTSTSAARTSSH